LTVSDDLTVTDDASVGGSLTVQEYISLPGTQPTPTADPGADRAYSLSMAKCWAYVETDGAGGTTVHDAFNVTSAVITGSSIRVTFARGFASANYCVVVTSGNGGDFPTVTSKNAGYVDVAMFDAATPAFAIDPTAFFLRFNVLVFGRQ
jgi:hypothetical protein